MKQLMQFVQGTPKFKETADPEKVMNDVPDIIGVLFDLCQANAVDIVTGNNCYVKGSPRYQLWKRANDLLKKHVEADIT